MQNILEYFTRTGDAVWAVDADYRILLWNAAAEELLGYSAEEASGQTCYELLGGCDLDGNPVCGAECPIADSTEQGLTVDAFDMQIRRNDGRFSLLNVSIIAVPDRSGLEAGAGAPLSPDSEWEKAVRPPSTHSPAGTPDGPAS